jgi:hypothetical protein
VKYIILKICIFKAKKKYYDSREDEKSHFVRFRKSIVSIDYFPRRFKKNMTCMMRWKIALTLPRIKQMPGFKTFWLLLNLYLLNIYYIMHWTHCLQSRNMKSNVNMPFMLSPKVSNLMSNLVLLLIIGCFVNPSKQGNFFHRIGWFIIGNRRIH